MLTRRRKKIRKQEEFKTSNKDIFVNLDSKNTKKKEGKYF